MRAVVTKESDYAIRALLDLARHHPKRRTSRQVGAAMDLPRNMTTQVLAKLVRHHILDSQAGPAGGYTLARPPSEITLLEVIETIEGPIAQDKCALDGGSCDWESVCPLHETLVQATAGLVEHLTATTFAVLSETDRAIRAGTYQPPPQAPPHSTTPPRRGHSD